MREEIIGDCRLILGDCRDVLPTLEDNHETTGLLTDPPYGLAEKLQGGTWGKKFEGKDYNWDAKSPNLSFLPLVPSIIWGGNYMSVNPSRCWLVWYKRDAVRTMADCELAWTNLDANSRVFDWTIAATNAERVGHPTQKPVRLMQWCIGQLPEGCHTILDPYMGSGTTGVACAKMGKHFIGIEREPKYFSVACKRIEQAYREPDLFAPKQTPMKQSALFN